MLDVHNRHRELASLFLNPLHRPAKKGVSCITDDVGSFDSHDKAAVFSAEDVDLSEVPILEGVDKLEGVGGVDGGVAHLK